MSRAPEASCVGEIQWRRVARDLVGQLAVWLTVREYASEVGARRWLREQSS